MKDTPSSLPSVEQLAARYDEFQAEAVQNIIFDYKNKLSGRYLLVIPTGGGKTFTAVKAVNRLFHEGLLDKDSDQVVWAAHREELIVQATETFKKYSQSNPEESYEDCVEIMMISGVESYVRKRPNVKIVVIDEAHHATEKNIQYGPLFDYPKLGILGLTATPSRHDGEPLEFEKESYSIGFPDLVEKQIILAPIIRSIEGGTFKGIQAKGAIGFRGLNRLNSAERDNQIIRHIENHSEDYKKIIIYAGSVEHAKSLRGRIQNSSLNELYESVDFITGTERSGNEQDRESFFERVKSHERAIVVNFDVLTEGYDDPKVNAVVMARPTRSKLVYMQAAGRCVRVDPDDCTKRAFIVEVDDNLPNIRYRIDNRWLFSEISDTLEPKVIDRFFSSATDFRESLEKIYREYKVDLPERLFPEWDPRTRYSLLLFRVFMGQGSDGNQSFRHIPILIDGTSRAAVSNWFNFLSERMQKYSKMKINWHEAMRAARYENVPGMSFDHAPKLIFEAMEEAWRYVEKKFDPDDTQEPWVTFVAFRAKRDSIGEEMEEFISDMVNREVIREALLTGSHPHPAKLIKLPLPLGNSIGSFMDDHEFEMLQEVIEELDEMKTTLMVKDHRADVRNYLSDVVLPLPTSFVDLLPPLVRENQSYFLTLE